MFGQWIAFKRLVAERDKGIRMEKVFTDRTGKKVFVVMKAEEERAELANSHQ